MESAVKTDDTHTHIWLPANDGKEWVCGDCGKRKPVDITKK